MKKHRSRMGVIILSIILLMVGCNKADPTDNKEVTKDSTVSSEGATAGNNEVSAEGKDAATTDNQKEPTATPKPTATVAPTNAPEINESVEPTEAVETVKDVVANASGILETIQETVLFNQDGVRVTAKEIITDFWGKGISVLIENDTDKNIGIMSNTYVVNNYMCMNFSFSSVAPRSESTDTIPLNMPDISVKGIDIISEVAVSFVVFDNDSGENLFATEETVIPTSAYGSVKLPMMENGFELINQDGIKIIGKYVEEDSSWGLGALLYIENTTDRDLLFQMDNMYVNGISIFPFFSCQVNKKREALDAIAIMDYDLSDNGITDINEIALMISGIDPYTYEVVHLFNTVIIPVED